MPSIEPTQHGFALGERPFFQPIHEKSDAEALREWETKAALLALQGRSRKPMKTQRGMGK